MNLRAAVAIAPMILMCGCATMFGGATQVISVDTTPSGAYCEATRDGLRLHSGVAPTSFPVDKSYSSINVSCVDALNRHGSATSKPGLEPWVFGNLLIGGLVGLTVDLATASVNKYDARVAIDMGAYPPGIRSTPVPLSAASRAIVSASAVPLPRRDLLVEADVNRQGGVVLLNVLPGGAGAAAGLQAGDQIVRFNGAEISNVSDMQRELTRIAPNSAVRLMIWRGDKQLPAILNF